MHKNFIKTLSVQPEQSSHGQEDFAVEKKKDFAISQENEFVKKKKKKAVSPS